ncbi:MAG TPA: DUF6544 family protein [Gemmatimonadales bacterium]|nr:DUF6544 family protein [Gemmatimonadales bacterium]
MRATKPWTAAVAGLAAVSGFLAAGAGSRRWRAATRRLVADLDRAAREPSMRTVSFDALAPLPDPVRGYFEQVLRDGQRPLRGARVLQRGTFRSRKTDPDPEAGWSPLSATQRFTAEPPGFVWDARIRVAPLVSVRVRDGYVAGRACMRGAVAGLLPIVDAADDTGLRAGALMRYLAEAVWFPTALLPGRGVTWAAMDERHARATLADAGTTAALEFEFGTGGEIVAVYAPERPRAVPGRTGAYVMAPWGGRYGGYQEHGGMLVPTTAEVYWVLHGREQSYYRGRNVAFEYDLGS